jgi:hypothetical protein
MPIRVGSLTAQLPLNWENAHCLGYGFSEVLDGRNAYPSNRVERTLGRKPRDFAAFAHQTTQLKYGEAIVSNNLGVITFIAGVFFAFSNFIQLRLLQS